MGKAKWSTLVREVIIQKKMPDEEIAQWLGITRKNVSKLRAEWKRLAEGRERKSRRRFDLVDTEEL